jgi:peptide/nickel transport system substrate-binding protein
MRALIQMLVQDDLKKIGIKVNTAVYEWAVFITNYITTREFDACVLGWALYYNYDLHGIWHSSQADPPGMNSVSYKNPDVDRLLEKVRTTFDRDEITKLCGRIQELIYHDQPYLFCLEAKPTYALYNDLYMVRRPAPDGGWIVEPVRQTQQGHSFYMQWWASRSIAPQLMP